MLKSLVECNGRDNAVWSSGYRPLDIMLHQEPFPIVIKYCTYHIIKTDIHL